MEEENRRNQKSYDKVYFRHSDTGPVQVQRIVEESQNTFMIKEKQRSRQGLHRYFLPFPPQLPPLLHFCVSPQLHHWHFWSPKHCAFYSRNLLALH